MQNIKMYNQEFKIELGKKLKTLRIIKKLTQEELSFVADVSRSHIGMLEKGARDVTLGAIYRLSRALEIDLPTLFDFDDLNKFWYTNEKL